MTVRGERDMICTNLSELLFSESKRVEMCHAFLVLAAKWLEDFYTWKLNKSVTTNKWTHLTFWNLHGVGLRKGTLWW